MNRRLRLLLETADDFVESEHPRRSDGEFAPKGTTKTAPAPKGSRRAGLHAAPENRESWPDHVKRLKIPPGWRDVKYSADPDADLLVLAKDAKGRDLLGEV